MNISIHSRVKISLYVNNPQNSDLKNTAICSLAGYLENSANNDLLFIYSNDEDDEVDIENPLRIVIVSKTGMILKCNMDYLFHFVEKKSF